ncbi:MULTISPECIES: winged helix DNA-binding domain-containing protein [unclassified Polaromonas]|uniref:winged helix DNA-binding domain-containing protein n=1 Tax=unclassified Polaromonas TaxID=2638319 RepID=UPI0013DDE782|nr:MULTISPECIES: winged helix DNA-binding domain-containing protein [unclassified Polaromonas]
MRLASHRLVSPFSTRRIEQAVQWSGAVQAQEYTHARWAIGSRFAPAASATDTSIEQAVAKRKVIRTWALRGTLHLVAAADVRWLLALAAPALLTRTAASYRDAKLDAAAFRKILPAVRQCLEGGQQLTRAALFEELARRRIDTGGHRGGLILYRAAQTGLICLGLPSGKQATYTLLDEWLPQPAEAPEPSREDGLKRLAQRYFTSHGPATLADFTWWSGLAAGEAKAALEMALPGLSEALHAGSTVWWSARTPVPSASPISTPMVHLLAGFDEYLLGYTDRTPIIDKAQAGKVMTPNGLFRPALLVDGRVAGTWQAETREGALVLSVAPFAPALLSRKAGAALQEAAQRHAAFNGLALGEIRNGIAPK